MRHNLLSLISALVFICNCAHGTDKWGATNCGLRVGLHFTQPENGNWNNPTAFFGVMLIVTNVSSNTCTYFIPIKEQAFKARLLGPSGEVIDAKWSHRKMGKKPHPSFGLTHRSFAPSLFPPKETQHIIYSNMAMHHAINIHEIFDIKKAGLYTLEYEVRLFILTNGMVTTVTFPTLKANLKLRPP